MSVPRIDPKLVRQAKGFAKIVCLKLASPHTGTSTNRTNTIEKNNKNYFGSLSCNDNNTNTNNNNNTLPSTLSSLLMSPSIPTSKVRLSASLSLSPVVLLSLPHLPTKNYSTLYSIETCM